MVHLFVPKACFVCAVTATAIPGDDGRGIRGSTSKAGREKRKLYGMGSMKEKVECSVEMPCEEGQKTCTLDTHCMGDLVCDMYKQRCERPPSDCNISPCDLKDFPCEGNDAYCKPGLVCGYYDECEKQFENDQCKYAIDMTSGDFFLTGNNYYADAASADLPICPSNIDVGGPRYGLWYSYTELSQDRRMAVKSLGGQIAVYEGHCDELQCVGALDYTCPDITPTLLPTLSPTNSPTNTPTNSPTNTPTVPATSAPTKSPTSSPTNTPTKSPTGSPTSPTTSPTAGCEFEHVALDEVAAFSSLVEQTYIVVGNGNTIYAQSCTSSIFYGTIIEVRELDCALAAPLIARTSDGCGSPVSWDSIADKNYSVTVFVVGPFGFAAQDEEPSVELYVSETGTDLKSLERVGDPAISVPVEEELTAYEFVWEAKLGVEYYFFVHNIVPEVLTEIGDMEPVAELSAVTDTIIISNSNGARGEFDLALSPLEYGVCTEAYPFEEYGKIAGCSGCPLPSGTQLCDNPDFTKEGSWYTVKGNGGTCFADTCFEGNKFTNKDKQVLVYKGADCDAVECVNTDQSICDLGDQSIVTWESEVNATYYVLVSGVGDAEGCHTLEVACGSPPPKDCDAASPVELGSVYEADGTAGTAFTNWLKAPGTGKTVNVASCESIGGVVNIPNYDQDYQDVEIEYDSTTIISIYYGNCEELTYVGSTDDGCAGISYESDPDKIYYILVQVDWAISFPWIKSKPDDAPVPVNYITTINESVPGDDRRNL